MSKVTLTKRERRLTVVTIVLVATMSFWWFFVLPINSDLEATNGRIKQAKGLLTRYDEVFAEEQEILSNYRKLRGQEIRPDLTSSSVDMIEKIQTLSNDIVTFKSIRPVSGTSLSGRSAVAFECVASFDNILRLLYRIEKENYYMSIKSLAISRSAGDPQLLNARFTVDSGEDE